MAQELAYNEHSKTISLFIVLFYSVIMLKASTMSPRTPRSPSNNKASSDTATLQRWFVAAFVILAASCPFIALSSLNIHDSTHLQQQHNNMAAFVDSKSVAEKQLLLQVKSLENTVEALNSSQATMAKELSLLHEQVLKSNQVIERLNNNNGGALLATNDSTAALSPRRTTLAAIVKRHNLTTPDAIDLLERISQQTLEYDSDQDFLVFEHMMKTGGTSLSDVLNKSIGGILPGSQRSDYFHYKEFEESYANATNKQDWWKSQKVLFSHTMLRPMYKSKSEYFDRWLTSKLPSKSWKNMKFLTLIREPVNYMASNMNEWMCQQDNRRRASVQRLMYWKKNCQTKPCPHLNSTILGDPNIWASFNKSDACKGLSREFLANDWWQHEGQPKCASSEPKNKRWTRICQEEKPLDYCRSPQKLMTSSKGPFSLLHDSYRLWVLPPSDHATRMEYESSALLNLGGLASNNNNDTKYPTWWLGVTERMHESMCLLHYSLQIPFVETPHTRFYHCRPTSDWTNADRHMAQQKEQLNFAAFRAANAILDVRVANMCRDVKEKRANNETFASIPDSCCANEIELGWDTSNELVARES